MRKILFCLVLIFLNSSLFSQEFKREKYNFNSDWKLKTGDSQNAESPVFDDTSWRKVTLPHAYNQEEAFEKDIDNHTTGIVWYRKKFKLSKGIKDKKIFLEFEGIRQGGVIYVNGQKTGLHENGVMGFGFDISKIVKPFPEENTIALRIDNDWKYKEIATGVTYQWNNMNFNANYGGIPKNVFLHITGKLYQTLPLYSNLKTTGVYIYPSDINIQEQSAVIHTETEVRNEFETAKTVEYDVIIEDNDGNKTASFSGEKTTLLPNETKIIKASKLVNNLHFWSWGYGYLYTIKTILKVDGKVIDEVSTKTGFRKTAFKNGEIWLNDRVIQVKGYAQRTSNEWPAIGMSVPSWLSDFSNKLIVEGNGNLVRWMHVTPWKQDVESCDRVGLLQAMPAGDAEKDAKGEQWNQRVNLMRDAIIYNRNNPSIIFYESGNESISEEHMREMKDIRNLYDPNGGRAIGSREMLDNKEAEYGGEMLYINKSAQKPLWATEYSRDEGLRKYWDEFSPPFHKEGVGPLYRDKPAEDYNHNQDRHAIENIVRWYDYYRERPGTGKRVNSGGVNIIFSDSNTHHRGESNYRTSGEVDAMRIPKDGFWAHQVMWDGWVDIEKHRTHIMGHWNYTDKVVKNIYVVSTASKVEFFINGISQGFGKQSNQFLFTFENITFKEGTIKAIGYDEKGVVLSEDSKSTAGIPAAIKLKLTTQEQGFLADGADVALIDVEVTDQKGNRCPISNDMISFSVDGPVTWLGGIAQGPKNYILSKTIPVENGVNRVMLQSMITGGKIKISATAKGLKSAELIFESKAIKTQNGLSKEIPGVHLASNLERGPTPSTPSYTIKRNSVTIISAFSPSNNNDTFKSYDDNELTEWKNDGNVKNGLITYTLSKPSIVNECVIKLTGWRSKTYPIRILADGKEIFKGNTTQSLGYITIPVEPVLAEKITIELIGSNTEKDGFSKIVEVEANKDLDLFKDPTAVNAKGQLRIVEIEFYEKIK
ncbi:glycoside hydrolase family 2 protein [Flavobacterium sp. CF136]|uniref:glycoside hydrolase family 2 protein n=1 Tax=Flavobacterium sp. (strain CF136) TaxID=1144313 RepID=UPI0002718E6A|nr:sugar-binding domain-containing protein [Flavobacterium sp. CF136]EJL60483.1 beta-galactosidase/beta-glucuronidase [Flavobacterium sp. CF136]